MQQLPKAFNKAQEAECIQRLQGGDPSAREDLINHNLRLVAYCAKKYTGNTTGKATHDTDDLQSIGSIGLIKAVDTFDPSKGFQFATYAAMCINNEILMGLRKSTKYDNRTQSLEAPIGQPDKDGNTATLADILEDNRAAFTGDIENNLVIESVLQRIDKELNKKERQVFEMRFLGQQGGDGELTQTEVAEKIGVSQSYIARIEAKVGKKLSALSETASAPPDRPPRVVKPPPAPIQPTTKGEPKMQNPNPHREKFIQSVGAHCAKNKCPLVLRDKHLQDSLAAYDKYVADGLSPEEAHEYFWLNDDQTKSIHKYERSNLPPKENTSTSGKLAAKQDAAAKLFEQIQGLQKEGFTYAEIEQKLKLGKGYVAYAIARQKKSKVRKTELTPQAPTPTTPAPANVKPAPVPVAIAEDKPPHYEQTQLAAAEKPIARPAPIANPAYDAWENWAAREHAMETHSIEHLNSPDLDVSKALVFALKQKQIQQKYFAKRGHDYDTLKESELMAVM